jgi:hypothetical protein
MGTGGEERRREGRWTESLPPARQPSSLLLQMGHIQVDFSRFPPCPLPIPTSALLPILLPVCTHPAGHVSVLCAVHQQDALDLLLGPSLLLLLR